MLWVFIPLYVLYEAYRNTTRAFAVADRLVQGKKSS
jgi:hypothetical protein